MFFRLSERDKRLVMTLHHTPNLTPDLTGKTRAVIDTLQAYALSRVRVREHITGNMRTFHARENVHVRRVHPYARKVLVNVRHVGVRSGVRCKVRVFSRAPSISSSHQKEKQWLV